MAIRAWKPVAGPIYWAPPQLERLSYRSLDRAGGDASDPVAMASIALQEAVEAGFMKQVGGAHRRRGLRFLPKVRWVVGARVAEQSDRSLALGFRVWDRVEHTYLQDWTTVVSAADPGQAQVRGFGLEVGGDLGFLHLSSGRRTADHLFLEDRQVVDRQDK